MMDLKGSADDAGLPRDARGIIAILKSMGVEECEPRVINQLLEFKHRYVAEVLQDAAVYADHAGRSEIEIGDVKLGIQGRVSFSFTQPPPREVLFELCQQRNSVPLPLISNRTGLLLPPEQDTLTTPNYMVKPPKGGAL
eukprot:jgi/Mesvir1/26134/Mv06847-RA.1